MTIPNSERSARSFPARPGLITNLRPGVDQYSRDLIEDGLPSIEIHSAAETSDARYGGWVK